MRKAPVLGIALLVISIVVLGGTVFRQPVADATGLLNVFVTNDSSHPVPVREQNTDANGNIKVHEQGTANVNVTNSSLSVTAPAVTGGGMGTLDLSAGETDNVCGINVPCTATALDITMTPGVLGINFGLSGKIVAGFNGPAFGGPSSIVLPLTRPISFDSVSCGGGLSDTCVISWVGAQS